jgi:tetratricopeptide (TPR) repeat protein
MKQTSLTFVIALSLAVCLPAAYAGELENEFPGIGSIEAWKSSRPEFANGLAFMRSKQWDQAIARFRAALALYPSDYRCYLEIGRAIEEKGGSVDDAEDAYRSALRLNSQSWRAWKRLANILFIKKKYGDAREAVSNAIQLNPPPRERAELEGMIQSINSGERIDQPELQ